MESGQIDFLLSQEIIFFVLFSCMCFIEEKYGKKRWHFFSAQITKDGSQTKINNNFRRFFF